MFLRYEPEKKPVVSSGQNGLEVRIQDIQLGTQLVIPADMLILAVRIDPAPDNEILSQFFKIPLNQDGFFLEAHMKLRPVDFATEGMFLAGMAHSPKSLAESISQGEAAASRAATIISKDIYEAEATIASVNEDICSGCGVCVSVCEFEALQLVETFDGNKVVVVNEAVCKGCGCCGGVCPSGAMEQKGFKTEQILAAIEAALL
jgi:heterodisulfide reductase subunit A